MFEVPRYGSFEAWRNAARADLATRVPAGMPLRLPRELMRVLRNVACFRNDGRWELMSRIARRTLTERRDLIEDVVDPDVRHALDMDKAVRRDVHKMHAFVRFREIAEPDGTRRYVSWFEPAHEILRTAAPFFVKRFANMDWTIATPDGTAIWHARSLEIIDAPGTQIDAADGSEELWRTYYRSICNVARINPRAMLREMPKRYWVNLPEASEIGALVHHGREQLERRSVAADIDSHAAARALARVGVSGAGSLTDLQSCQRCALWQHATQAVAGNGPVPSGLMLVGEQPGDEEDLRGVPFVGPAGRLLDELLREGGLDRSSLYLTNAVKHFKWEPRGKRRLHKRPDAGEVSACNGWLQQEIQATQPRIILALGATALLALLGSRSSIDSHRGRVHPHPSGADVIVTYHPSALLRADPQVAERLRAAFLEDLRQVGTLLHGVARPLERPGVHVTSDLHPQTRDR